MNARMNGSPSLSEQRFQFPIDLVDLRRRQRGGISALGVAKAEFPSPPKWVPDAIVASNKNWPIKSNVFRIGEYFSVFLRNSEIYGSYSHHLRSLWDGFVKNWTNCWSHCLLRTKWSADHSQRPTSPLKQSNERQRHSWQPTIENFRCISS
jgi:hypothetical protein